jgi:hypothetical protein
MAALHETYTNSWSNEFPEKILNRRSSHPSGLLKLRKFYEEIIDQKANNKDLRESHLTYILYDIMSFTLDRCKAGDIIVVETILIPLGKKVYNILKSDVAKSYYDAIIKLYETASHDEKGKMLPKLKEASKANSYLAGQV